MSYEPLPIESLKTAVISIARFGAAIRLQLTNNETPSGLFVQRNKINGVNGER